jgi:hypothetical protein
MIALACAMASAEARAQTSETVIAATRVYPLTLRGSAITGADLVTPARGAPTLRISQADAIDLRIASDSPTLLHLHGYNIEARSARDEAASLRFTARATGRFPLETHGPGAHRVVLYLEVLPR